jgi:hypothetical protein
MEGASKYNFNPVMNYPGDANKYINKFASTTGKMVDAEGNYYYVSHPPFAYIFPYLVFKLFNIKGTVLAIEIFHLVINFMSALFVYLIIGTLRNKKSFEKIDWTGILGYTFYLFSAGVLWFQCNTYMSDMLVHLFFITGVYFLLRIFLNNQTSGKYLILFAANLFLMIYTSWLGIIFAFCVFLYSIIWLRKERIFKKIILVTTLVSIASIGLFVYQYSLIIGLDTFMEQMQERLVTRSGWGASSKLIMKLKDFFNTFPVILYNYATAYLPFTLLLGYFIYLTIKTSGFRLKLNRLQFLFIWISLLPIIIVHTFLSQYSGHDFSSLYASLILSVAIAILFERLRKSNTIPVRRLQILVLLSILLSISSYYYINRPGKFSIKGDEYSVSKQLGLEIKNTSTNDAVIFAIGEAEIHPQIIFYAQRNIKEVSTKEEAFAYLISRQIKRGFIYYSSDRNNTQFDKIEEISLDNK